MKGIAKFLLGAVLGGGVGWCMGYLRLPYLDPDSSPGVGFALGVGTTLLVVALVRLWNRAGFLRRRFDGAGASRGYRLAGVTLVVAMLAAGMGANLLLQHRNELLAESLAQAEVQNRLAAAQLAAVRNAEQVGLMRNVIEQVEREIHAPDYDSLSEATIARIAALSEGFKPYQYFEGDSLAERLLSPERGVLLQSLVNLGIDSASWARVKARTTFAQADLSRATLNGADLSGVNLTRANLTDAQLRHAQLTSAQMREATLWGADLDSAVLAHAYLYKADVRWAKLNGADMHKINLNGANLSNSQLYGANMAEATFRFGIGEGTGFMKANLWRVDCLGCHLAKVNFSGADLRRMHLRWILCPDAHLQEADLDSIGLSFGTWAEVWEEWQLAPNPSIESRYIIGQDSTVRLGAKYMALKRP